MNEFGPLLDGRMFLANSPFRSWHFLGISVVGLGILIMDTYVLCRHWQTLPLSDVVALVVFIGVHTIYQWWRALLYYSKIRQLHSSMEISQEGNDMSPQETALRIAAGGVTDILFYSFGMTFIALGILASTLRHLEGIR